MPIADWQFVVVTLIAIGALWVLVRRLVPRSSRGGKAADPSCAHCASNAQKPQATPDRAARTSTTPVVSLHDLRETARK